MRRLALLFALVSTALSPVEAQSMRGAPRPNASGIGTALTGYDAATASYFAAMTTQPDGTRKALLSNLVTCVEGAGLFPKLDWLVIHAMHDSQAGLVNMIAPNKVMQNVNGMTFTTDLGYTGNGTNSYLKANETMLVGGINFSLNSGTIGVWVNSAMSGNLGLVGALYNNNTSIITGAGALGNRVNGATSVGTTVGTNHHYTAIRTNSTTVIGYLNGGSAVTNSSSTADGSIPVGTQFTVGQGRSGFSTARNAASYYGGALTSTDVGALHTCLNTYLSTIGAQ